MDENNEAKDHWGPPLQTPDPNFRYGRKWGEN